MSSKVNALATMISHGWNGYHSLKLVNLVDDVNQVWNDSRKGVEMYQMSVYGQQEIENTAVGGEGENKPNSNRLQQDNSDQISQSPNIDGMATK